MAYALIVASYRRRMGVIAVREMARHRYRQSQFAGLYTRLDLTPTLTLKGNQDT